MLGPNPSPEEPAMRRRLLIALPVVALLGLPGCATTSFNSTWRDPAAQPVRLDGRKVAAVFMSRNPTSRRTAEDALAAEITKRGGIGIPSYSLLAEENPQDPEAVRRQLADSEVDGVITMRVVRRDEQSTYVPGHWTTAPYYGTWSGYWGSAWREVYEPGYLQIDTVVSVETLVYSFVQDRLLWAGMSETINPARADQLARELAGKVANQLQKEGLLAS
jgi:hypothetical protein